MVILTVGHSTRSIDEFVALLRAHDVDALADVRRYPGSRRHPQFGRDALAEALRAAGIAYEHIEELGGRRDASPDSPNTAWRNEQFRGYADHMRSRAFARGLARLLDLAQRKRVAVMCAEAVPWRCHRNLLADALLAHEIRVEHLMSPTERREHTLHATARLEGERVIYDRSEQTQLPL